MHAYHKKMYKLQHVNTFLHTLLNASK
uniref:Uncharacterized protein n=1 Tax=Rhizophora mucronata TaxID=61149 RepID=A0A2P2NQ56_RHIMU